MALTVNVDGFGNRPNKRSKYREFTRGRRDRHHGFKLFYNEDTNMMQPRRRAVAAPAAGAGRLRVNRPTPPLT